MHASAAKKRPRSGSPTSASTSTSSCVDSPSHYSFDDSSTSDLVLRLVLDPSASSSPTSPSSSPSSSPPPTPPHLDFHLHSSALLRSPYFSALLSDRWRTNKSASSSSLFELVVPSFDPHVTVLRLLYTLDFSSALLSVSSALSLLPVALSLLFDDLVRACVRFLEAVPWSFEEELHVLRLSPLLPPNLSSPLLARLVLPSPSSTSKNNDLSEEMLRGLVNSAISNNHPSVPSVKVFVAKLLQDFQPRHSVRRVLDRAFLGLLASVRALLAAYASPDFRVAGDNEETEAMQRLNIHKALVSTRKLLWLVERMVDLHIADTAAAEWSYQDTLAVDLEKAFRDETCRNIAPALPALVMRCTSRLANAVAAGTVLAPRQVRFVIHHMCIQFLLPDDTDNRTLLDRRSRILHFNFSQWFDF